jgi:hypothetical protein
MQMPFSPCGTQVPHPSHPHTNKITPSKNVAGDIKVVSDSAAANAALLQALSLELKTQAEKNEIAEKKLDAAERKLDAAVGRINQLEKVCAFVPAPVPWLKVTAPSSAAPHVLLAATATATTLH